MALIVALDTQSFMVNALHDLPSNMIPVTTTQN